MDKERLRIAYVTRGKADHPGNWSGIVQKIREALAEAGHDVQTIDGIPSSVPLLSRIRGRLVRLASGKTYAYDRDLGVLRRFAHSVEKQLARLNVDCVVCPLLPTAALLRTPLPIAVWDDGPFHCLRQIYSQYANLADDSLRQGDRVDGLAIRKAMLLAFASHWAANDALNYHHADPDKTVVVPFGANCASSYRDEAEVMQAFDRKPTEPLRLLFVGIDWERKGGPLTLDILKELHRRGVNATLTIVGCNPFQSTPPEGVTCLGKLDKGIPEEAKRWQNSFLEAHIFLMPTRAECFGVVYAEAAAHGLPSIGTRVGGVPDAVAEGISGWLFELQDGARKYVDLIQSLAGCPDKLREYSLTAFRHQQKELNWPSTVQRFISALRDRMPPNASAKHRHPAP